MPPQYHEVSHSVPGDYFKIKIVSRIPSVQYRESQLIAPGIKHISKGHHITINTKGLHIRQLKLADANHFKLPSMNFNYFFVLPLVDLKKPPRF